MQKRPLIEELVQALEGLLVAFESIVHDKYGGTSFLEEELAKGDAARAAIRRVREEML